MSTNSSEPKQLNQHKPAVKDHAGTTAFPHGHTSTHAPSLPSIDELQNEFAKTCNTTEDDALKSIAQHVKGYSDDMIKKWNKDIDTLLVYAGLFSTVLTAFNVQSYLLLQPVTPDPTLLVLQQISLQLNSFSVNPSGALINSTHPVQFPAAHASPIDSWAVWLNSLWFSALICSLSSATIGILVKQWVHTLKHQTGISGKSLEFARLRQYRLNHWKKWHVAEIIAILPTLLQISLFLFFSGILILLWHYHSTVAIVATILIGIVASFVVGTTVMPIFWEDCCYLSPPVYPLFTLVQSARYSLNCLRRVILHHIHLLCHRVQNLNCPSRRVRSVVEAVKKWSSASELWSLHTPVFTLPDRDQNIVQNTFAELQIDMLTYAYATTVDATHLSGTAWVIIANKRISPELRHKFYSEIKKVNNDHFQAPYSHQSTPPDMCAGELVFTANEDAAITYLFDEWSEYKNTMDAHTCHRLLLSLTAMVVKTRPNQNVYTKSLALLEKLFTSGQVTLESMPWRSVCYVAAAAGKLLQPSSDKSGLKVVWPHWSDVNEATSTVQDWEIITQWLNILVQCCFAPVTTWQRSREQKDVFVRCLLNMTALVPVSSDRYQHMFSLWEDIFSFGPSALQHVPWESLENVMTVAQEILIPKPEENKLTTALATPNDSELVFRSLRILIWCCFMPVPSWKPSQEKVMEKLTAITFGSGIFEKEALSNTARNLGNWPNPKVMLDTLMLILTYMSDSYLGPNCNPDSFLDAVQAVVDIGKALAKKAAMAKAAAESQAAFHKAAVTAAAAAKATADIEEKEQSASASAVATAKLAADADAAAAAARESAEAAAVEARITFTWSDLRGELDELTECLNKCKSVKVQPVPVVPQERKVWLSLPEFNSPTDQ